MRLVAQGVIGIVASEICLVGLLLPWVPGIPGFEIVWRGGDAMVCALPILMSGILGCVVSLIVMFIPMYSRSRWLGLLTFVLVSLAMSVATRDAVWQWDTGYVVSMTGAAALAADMLLEAVHPVVLRGDPDGRPRIHRRRALGHVEGRGRVPVQGDPRLHQV